DDYDRRRHEEEIVASTSRSTASEAESNESIRSAVSPAYNALASISRSGNPAAGGEGPNRGIAGRWLSIVRATIDIGRRASGPLSDCSTRSARGPSGSPRHQRTVAAVGTSRR